MTDSNFKKTTRKQRTLKKTVSFSGIGIHTGGHVTLRFCPAAEGAGVSFQRTDLPGKPVIPANVKYVLGTIRQTLIGIGDARIHTIEHVLAAVRAYEIDNLRIEMNGAEPPSGDGSSNAFVQMIEEAGIVEQGALKNVIEITQPLYFSDRANVHVVAIPSDEYRISYTLYYPDVAAIRSQYYSFKVSSEGFKAEIAPCRTFSLYEEVKVLMERGLIKGGSLDNSVVIDKEVIYSKEGLRFPDEMARHKILDMIGDLSLVGFSFKAHILAICSGHATNVAFAKVLFNSIPMESH